MKMSYMKHNISDDIWWWKESLCVCVYAWNSIVLTSDPHLTDILRTKGNAVSSRKWFGWAQLKKAASSNTEGHTFWMGRDTLWKGAWLEIIKLNKTKILTLSTLSKTVYQIYDAVKIYIQKEKILSFVMIHKGISLYPHRLGNTVLLSVNR